ncbi:CsbD family protein [Kushneria sp. TE3]|uniref:CsbD family protein n=1 Tax=Kushneria sp. TE3 TaxID=3449832 RepID=UPI003F683426
MSDKSPPLEDLKGKIKEAWGTLGGDEALSDEGEIQQLAARLEKEQGLSSEEALRQAEKTLHGERR